MARRSLLSTDAAAALAACGPVSIRRAVAAGELEALRLGEHGHLRIAPDALAAWLQPARDPAEAP